MADQAAGVAESWSAHDRFLAVDDLTCRTGQELMCASRGSAHCSMEFGCAPPEI
jgi:hypothetical protein